MEEPQCKICGKRHYKLCQNDKEEKPKGMLKVAVTRANAAKSPGAKNISHHPSKSAFDRVSYQREYMRKWRKRKESTK